MAEQTKLVSFLNFFLFLLSLLTHYKLKFAFVISVREVYNL